MGRGSLLALSRATTAAQFIAWAYVNSNLFVIARSKCVTNHGVKIVRWVGACRGRLSWRRFILLEITSVLDHQPLADDKPYGNQDKEQQRSKRNERMSMNTCTLSGGWFVHPLPSRLFPALPLSANRISSCRETADRSLWKLGDQSANFICSLYIRLAKNTFNRYIVGIALLMALSNEALSHYVPKRHVTIFNYSFSTKHSTPIKSFVIYIDEFQQTVNIICEEIRPLDGAPRRLFPYQRSVT